ncbi:nicotinate-nucleotide--dimethylbenzimidazole phosphoribosyltransferase [Streptomyces sp. NBC_00083]|uniref:nicotinate-nucleotide--dimethylbenzimidazole phosphoribosyltransferase n=1 Tax=Streptomyces sp. NBC_00083 TaxID=2975647 RepID=UPI002255A477|nr:nicotinate-nucleotide--dimethylbenzimidazole phosphoribosyltransferase [Streptomyces sp. NBC_00083]MCX5383517.1 nicotinate-nucleotide--dimethylbenzimidazole phosphoribosyltransferase [Streptomyces sp. NBC_00083]
MTDTGQVPGEGLPENAGMVEQPGVPAPGAYTFLDPADSSVNPADDDDLLLMPGAQGAWIDPQSAPAPVAAPPAPGPAAEPGAHETGGRDTGSVDLGGARTAQAPASAAPPARRPLHLGPQVPDASAGVVRSLADRGPAGAPVNPMPTRTQGPPTAGPEYLDIPREEAAAQPAAPQLAEMQPGSGMAWTPQQRSAPHTSLHMPVAPAETVVPEDFAVHAAAQGVPPHAVEQQAPQMAQPGARPVLLVDQLVAQQAVRQDAPQAPQQGGQPQHAGQFVPVEGSVPTGPHLAPAPAQAGPVQEAPVQEAPAQGVQDVPQPAPEPVVAAQPEPVAPAGPVGPSAAEPMAPQEPVSEPPAVTEVPAEPAVAGFPAEPVAAEAQVAGPAQAAQVPAEALAAEPVVPEQAVAEAAPEQVVPEQAVPEALTPDPAVTELVAAEPLPVEPVVAAEVFAAPQPVAVEPVQAAVAEPESVAVAPDQAPTHVAVPVQQAVQQAPAEEQPARPGTAEPLAEAPAAVPEQIQAPEPVLVPQQDQAVTAGAPAADPVPAPEAPEAVVAPQPAPAEAAVPAAGPEAPREPEAADSARVAAPAEGEEAEELTDAVDLPEQAPAAPGYDDAEREAVLRVMRERRDIRNGFRSDPIPHEVLLRVLEAAHTAPSVGHSQPWDFVVIRSAETRRTMHELAQRQREAYAKSLPKGRAKQFKELKIEAILETPVNIVVTADPTRGGRHTLGRYTQPQMAPYSSALAVENLWLAARAEGLGVGWVSFFDEREMVRALGLPEHLEVVAYLCVGYVDEFPDEPELMQAGWSKRRPLSWVVHEETYGRRALPGEDPHDLLQETVSGIRPLDAKALGEAWERQKRMTKPAGALGMLEIISAQLSGLSRKCPPPIPEPAAVAIFAGDHGVHAQGVTPWPQEVTGQMVANFLGGGAVCNAFANQVGAEVCVIDVGVASELPATPGLLPRKVRAGTADMTTGPAMTREEAVAAIEVGIETARDLVAAGNKALLTGEMGIANTTVSAALISLYTGVDPVEVTGRGTGINDETHARKVDVVRRALDLHQPDPADPIGVLAAIGGLEHAALVGFLLGGASLRTPVILDGVSTGAAALVARAIAPEVLSACIAGHRSAEPGHVAALNKLGLRPLVDLDLRLGEGTGALLALPVVQSAARAMHEVATFDSAGVTEK